MSRSRRTRTARTSRPSRPSASSRSARSRVTPRPRTGQLERQRLRGLAERPPSGLVVEHLTIGGEQLVVFSWSESTTPPAALSDAERAVLARIVRGESNAAIARARKVSVRTIANQVASLLRKTGSASRFELIRRYAGAGGE